MNLLHLAVIAAGDVAKDGGSPFGGPKMMIIMVVVMGIMMVMTYLPQKRKQKEHKAMMSQLKAGDKIISAGGIYGEIHQVKEDSIVLKVDEKTKIEMARGSITRVVTDDAKNDSKNETKK